MNLGLAFLPLAALLPLWASEGAPACPLEPSGAQLAREAASQLAAGRYEQAEQASLCAAVKARGANDFQRLAKILNNLGAARLYQQDFAGAYEALDEARQVSRRLSQAETEASVWSNLATLYSMLSAWPAADDALRQAILLMPPDSRFLPALRAQQVRLSMRRPAARRGDFERLWSDAMQAAERLDDAQVQRHLWDHLAEHYLESGRLAEADDALANSFRIARLRRLPDEDSLRMLAGRLRLAQNRPLEALAWFERVNPPRGRYSHPVSALRLTAAQARAAALAHGPESALAVCRGRWGSVLAWRAGLLPDPAVELAADVALTELVDEYVGAAMAEPSLQDRSVEAWSAVEQTRALHVLRLLRRNEEARRRSGAVREPPAGRIREAAWTPSAAAAGGASGACMAVDIGPASAPVAPAVLLQEVQRALRPDQVLFTLWLGRGRAVVWAVARHGFAAAPLPPRAQMMQLLARARGQVLGQPVSGNPAGELYEGLFGGVPDWARQQPEWLVSADDELLTVPLAALQPPAGSGRYLTELRALTYVPSAMWLLEPKPRRPPQRLLAIGGLVHNGADARFSGTKAAMRMEARASAAAALELPSLPGSAREVEAAAAVWKNAGLDARVIGGFDATAALLEETLLDGWSDLHFATHVQPAPEPASYRYQPASGSSLPLLIRFPAGEPFLALSLRRDGIREGLSGRQLFRLRLEGTRVVLNGCSTGDGPAQAGAGISSLATAWLAAGADSVLASLWPVDDDGAFFESYYRSLLQHGRPASALRAAQAAMIQAGSWRSRPRHWAAYIHLGKD